MTKRKVSFTAYKKVKVPTNVKFRTNEGKTVSFKATKVKIIPKKVTFYTKKKNSLKKGKLRWKGRI